MRTFSNLLCAAALSLGAGSAAAQTSVTLHDTAPQVAPSAEPIFENTARLVFDKAEVISPSVQAEIEARLKAVSTQAGVDFVIVTLPDLNGQDSADLVGQAAVEWLADKPRPASVAAILLAPNEQELSYQFLSAYPEEEGAQEKLKEKIPAAERLGKNVETKLNDAVVPFFAVSAWELGLGAYVDLVSEEAEAFILSDSSEEASKKDNSGT